MLRTTVTKLASRRVLATTARLPAAARCLSASTWDAGESLGARGLHQEGAAKPWQAEGAFDIQRVTQQAMVHELVQQQTNTIEAVVPWFLGNMPASYFRQVPEKFRVDHIKAIAAIKGKNKWAYLGRAEILSVVFLTTFFLLNRGRNGPLSQPKIYHQ